MVCCAQIHGLSGAAYSRGVALIMHAVGLEQRTPGHDPWPPPEQRPTLALGVVVVGASHDDTLVMV
jgi:hypothetical protein